VLVPEREVEKVDVVDDFRPLFCAMGLLDRADEVPVRVLFSISGRDLPLAGRLRSARASVIESSGCERAKPGRALTCGNSTLSRGRGHAKEKSGENRQDGNRPPDVLRERLVSRPNPRPVMPAEAGIQFRKRLICRPAEL
jgi:hypothetical protein